MCVYLVIIQPHRVINNKKVTSLRYKNLINTSLNYVHRILINRGNKIHSYFSDF